MVPKCLISLLKPAHKSAETRHTVAVRNSQSLALDGRAGTRHVHALVTQQSPNNAAINPAATAPAQLAPMRIEQGNNVFNLISLKTFIQFDSSNAQRI
jgi:hypothetical protein